MSFPYIGTITIAWILFVGIFSATLIHNENIKSLNESSSISIASGNGNVAALHIQSEALRNYIVTSSIGRHFFVSNDISTSTSLVATPTNPPTTTNTETVVKNISLSDSFLYLGDLSRNKKFALNTAVSGDGSILYSTGVVCGTICSVMYPSGTSVKIIAVQSPGSVFSGWEGACSGTGSCIVKMSTLREVTATFTKVVTLPQTTALQIITVAQVTSHALPSDCWIIVSGKVYSVSAYIAMHPGGKTVITNMCGKDATSVFMTRGKTGTHSSAAWALLGGYLIGSISGDIPIAPTPVPKDSVIPPQQPVSPNQYTLSQISGHGTKSDCWIIISNNIYSVGSYIAMHPGGDSVIANLCGKDATTGFTTKNGMGTHSSSAWSLLGGFIVGTVTGTVLQPVVTPVPTLTPIPVPTPAPAGGPYTAAQVTHHSTVSDCWIVIGTNVYSVSSYISMHPGGAAVITNLCGKDATTGFNTKNGVGTHSSYAKILLGGFLVGTLSGPAPTPSSTPSPSMYTASQIAIHAVASDCWIVIGTNVYSVGAYLSLHPGGSYAISKLCGKNATTAFGNRGGTGTHSSAANSTIGGFLIGTLSGAAPLSSPLNQAPTTGYDLATIALHSSPTDCWIIVNTSVYSVATYVSLHPGGRTRITNLCGKDATSGFNGQGHSSTAKSILGGLLIGSYQVITTTPTPTPIPTPTPTPIPTPTPALSPISGVCGSANATIVSSSPNTNLCSAGVASSVSGAGPYNWSCAGSNGGASASCSAQKTTPSSASVTYTINVNNSGVYDQTSLTIKVGDKITVYYSTPRTNEVITKFTPSPPSSITVDSEVTSKTVTFTTAGTYTLKAQDYSGNTATVIVQ